MAIYGEIDDENIDYVDLRAVVRSILVARSQYGATIQEIKDDYRKFLACEFPYIESMTEFLLTIPEIICYTDKNGTRIFNLQSSLKSKHILEMVKNQKPSKNTQMTRSNQNLEYEIDHPKERLISTPENVCFFEDNYRYLNICNNKRRSSLTSHTISPSAKSGYDSAFSENEYDAHLYDYQLLGDDFFLSMAKMELKCRFTPGHKILRSGLCISGQTIMGATKRVLTAPYLNKNIIINIGSVDILHGRELIDIQHDFLNLMNACELRGVQPIVTTLVPLANLAYHPPTTYILKKFNEFIKSHCHKWKVIDLWHCMVNEHDHILFECYQNDTRYVTGSTKPHVFWNKLGRQRILKEIKMKVMQY